MAEISEHFTIGNVLGHGAFSTVYAGTQIETGRHVAIKKIDTGKCQKLSDISTEVAFLQELSHPNIVHMLNYFPTPQFHYIVVELLEGGELFDHIVERGHYSEKDAATILRQVLSGVSYLHASNIVHRDLKPENLLCANKDDISRIVISDFGLATQLEDGGHATRACGTPGYAAPEVLKRTPYDFPSDLFSIGVIGYIILCGYPPFYSETDDDKEICEMTTKGIWEFDSPDWDDVSGEAKDIISSMMEPVPRLRCTAVQALENPWVQGHRASATNIARRVSVQLSKHFVRQKWKRAINAQVAVQRLKSALASRSSSDST